jgi:hypothetical protein
LENSVWKRLWTCRKTDKYLNFEYLYIQFVPHRKHAASRIERQIGYGV